MKNTVKPITVMLILSSLFLFLNCTETLAQGDTAPPTYSDNSTNSTIAGTPVEHRLKWTDDTGLSGYIFQFCNGTWNGSVCNGQGWINDTWVEFPGNPTSAWSNVTKVTNSTVGSTIAWKVYANDTSGNWNASDTYSYTTTKKWLEVNWTIGSQINDTVCTPGSPCEFAQYSTFKANATITCKSIPSGLSCGSVIGDLRYNKTSNQPDTVINTTQGALPFWYEKNLSKLTSGTNFVLNGGFETGDTSDWTLNTGFTTPSINPADTSPHDGSYCLGSTNSTSTISSPNALLWSINQTFEQPVIVSDNLYLSLWIGGGDEAGYYYTNVTLGFSDGSKVIVASNLGRWYSPNSIYLGGNPGLSNPPSGVLKWSKLLSRIKNYKPVGSQIVNISIEIRKGPDGWLRYYPTICIDSIQLFNGTILFKNAENLVFVLPRSYPSGYLEAKSLIDYASVHQGATITASSSVPSSVNKYDFYLPKHAIDDLVFNESYGGSVPKYWKSNDEGAGAWVNITFPSSVSLNKVVLWDPPDSNNITSGHIEFSDNSKVYFGSLPPDGSTGLEINFDQRDTSWIKIVIDSVEGVAGLAEVDAYGEPTNELQAYVYTFGEGLDSYFEVYDASESFLLHNQTFSNIKGGDVYNTIGIKACGYMSDGDVCELGWKITTTGIPVQIRALDVNFSSSLSAVLINDTSNAYVKIIIVDSKIKGIVLDSGTGLPVANTTVNFMLKETCKSFSTTTDSNGEYEINFFSGYLTSGKNTLLISTNKSYRRGWIKNIIFGDYPHTPELCTQNNIVEVRGKVFDSGLPLSDATVKVTVEENEDHGSNVTDDSGNYIVTFDSKMQPGMIYNLVITITANDKKGWLKLRYPCC